ncbi:hypothetical protein Q3G72_004327 [Acer saccharum]|nr:hypothetical protein Q3G72_004327 [Acer saccharum]
MIKAEEDCLIDLVDKDSEDMQLHGEEVVQMMRVAVWCLQNDYNRRPSMSTVVKVLEGTMEFEASLTAVTRELEEQFGGATTSELLPDVLSGPSFGVVLLEIICCRKNLDQSLPEEQVILEEWVYQCFVDGELGQLVGDEEVEQKQLERIIKVALWCILDEPSLCPSMKKVLLMLEGTVDIPTTNPTCFISTI